MLYYLLFAKNELTYLSGKLVQIGMEFPHVLQPSELD